MGTVINNVKHGGGTDTTALKNVAASGYVVALRGSQPGYGMLVDQSPAGAVVSPNVALFPGVWVASTALSLSAYRSPVILNGLLYKVTTAGTTGATEPTWPTTIGGTVVDGTVTWTAEKGPWTINNGVKSFRPIKSTQIGNVTGTFRVPGVGSKWNVLNKDSFILHFRANSTSSETVKPIISMRGTGGDNKGVLIYADGGAQQQFYMTIYDGVTDRGSGAYKTSAITTARPLDGQLRSCVWMFDGFLKRGYFYVDGVPVPQSDMNTISDLSPHDYDYSGVLASLSAGDLVIGAANALAASYELTFAAFDYIVLPNRMLPANLAAVAAWFKDRDSLLPESLLI